MPCEYCLGTNGRHERRCPNCGSHWIKHIVIGEGVIKGCEMCKGRLDKNIKYSLIPFRAYTRETAFELMKARGLI